MAQQAKLSIAPCWQDAVVVIYVALVFMAFANIEQREPTKENKHTWVCLSVSVHPSIHNVVFNVFTVALWDLFQM